MSFIFQYMLSSCFSETTDGFFDSSDEHPTEMQLISHSQCDESNIKKKVDKKRKRDKVRSKKIQKIRELIDKHTDVIPLKPLRKWWQF